MFSLKWYNLKAAKSIDSRIAVTPVSNTEAISPRYIPLTLELHAREKRYDPRISYGTLPLESWILHGRINSNYTHCLSQQEVLTWFLTRTKEIWVAIHTVFWAQIFSGSISVLRYIEIIPSLCSKVILLVRLIRKKKIDSNTHYCTPQFLDIHFCWIQPHMPESWLFHTSRSKSITTKATLQ